jgi:chromosome segregation ATPase
MQIDISNLPPEVESLHKLIATLHEKNNDWASKYTKLSNENTSLANKYTKLADDNSKLSEQNSELLNRINKLEGVVCGRVQGTTLRIFDNLSYR